MPITFESPRWFWWLALCLPLIWVAAARWPFARGGKRWRRWGAVIVRALLVTGLVAAAARPVRWSEGRAVSAVALLDVSASISAADVDRERRLLAELWRAAEQPHELHVVSFAAAPVVQLPAPSRDAPARAAEQWASTALARPTGEAGLATDIAAALGLAGGLVDPSRDRRVLLVSDGRATTGDALAQAGRLRALGIRLDYVALGGGPTNGPADVSVDSLTVIGPPPAPGSTFPLRIVVAADRNARVRLTVTRQGDDGDDDMGTRDLTVAAGDNEVRWDARLGRGPKPTVFRAAVVLLDGSEDAHPENDRGILAIASQPPPRALLLAGGGAAEVASLTGALRAQSFFVEVAGNGRALDAAVTASGLASVDLVVLCDLPRGALTENKVGLLERYVRDGGGILVTGGPHAFGPGGWSGSRLEALLPVRLDVPHPRDEPSLALVLIVDRSGSMSGAKMELTKQAARGTAEMLPVDDQIAVIAFDSQATTVVPLQRAANRLRIATEIGRIQPTGGTNILSGLREGVDQLATARAKRKHAILLSDGQSATEGIAELVDAAVASHITISTIGVGDGVDEALMQLIARQGGGRYYRTRDPASIPRIFSRETSEVASSGLVERPTAVVTRKRAAMTSGIDWAGAPRLRGYVRTFGRAQADVLLAGETGDPLLARWSVGLGQVSAWTSDLGARWADDWTRWRAIAQVWGQIARGTMRIRSSRQFPMSAHAEGESVYVSIEAMGSDDRFLVGLNGTLQITAVEMPAGGREGGKPAIVSLVETAPGRYDARFPVIRRSRTEPAALLLHASFTGEGQPIAEAVGELSLPAAPELRPARSSSPSPSPSPSSSPRGTTPTGFELLAASATATGGGPLAAPADLFSGATPRRRAKSLRVPLLLAMTLLFLADIALRRLPVRPNPPPIRPSTHPARTPSRTSR